MRLVAFRKRLFYNYLLEENLTVNALPDYMLIEFFNWIKINDN